MVIPASSGQDVAVFLRIVQDPADPAYHAGHRIFVQMNGQSGFLLQEDVETADERPAARHDDAAVHDVGGELGGRDFQRAPHRIHDLLDRLLYRFAHFTRMDAHDLRNARNQVTSLHFHFPLFAHRGRRADLDLDLLRGGLTDQQVVVLAHELDDGLIQLIAARPDRRIRHDARQRDDRDFGRPAADVDHHVPRRRLDREADPDGGRHRLRHHVDLFRTRRLRGVAHRALLHFGDPGRDAHDHLRLHAEEMTVDDGLEEETEHLLGDVEVGDDAVLQRTHRENAVGRAPEHALRFESDPLDLAGRFFDRDHRGLVQDDAFALHVYKRVRRAEIDGDLVRGAPGTKFQILPAKWHRQSGAKEKGGASSSAPKVTNALTASNTDV